jgi:hypothetical protein
MTLDELKQAALDIAAKFPRPDHYNYAIVAARQKEISVLRKAYIGNTQVGSPIWELKLAQLNEIFTNEFSYGNGMSPAEIEARFEKAKAIKKTNAIIKGPAVAPDPILEEQALFFQMLPVNPITGRNNSSVPSLKGFWMLDCIIDDILRNPKYGFKRKIEERDAVQLSLLEFDVTTTDNRRKIGRRWSNEEQQTAFKELRDLEFKMIHRWNPDKGKHGGWEGYELQSVTTFHSLVPRDEAKEEKWGKRGAPTKKGENVQLRFKGIMTGPIGETIIMNAIFFRKVFAIPQASYSMSPGAQILHRQGLPFANTPEGWKLTRTIAFRALGYDENERRHRDRYTELIEKYLFELKVKLGWKIERQGAMKWQGETVQGWLIRAPRKLPARRRPKRLAK